jgi:prolyl 4-hydroxylase
MAAGRAQEAARLLFEAAAAGDDGALYMLAQWRIAGTIARRDLSAACRHLGQAAKRGHVDAALLEASFTAAGVGGKADWPAAVAALSRLEHRSGRAARQLRMLREMNLAPDGTPSDVPTAHPVSEAPLVLSGARLLTRSQCDYLREMAAPMLQPSVIVDPQTGRMVPHPVRTSDGAVFGVHSEDLVVNAVNRRIAAFSGTAVAQGEPLQLLRYRPGAEYRPHFDAIGGEANQRILTVIVYLNDDFDGGETAFPRTGFQFKGAAGDAILFRNVLPNGQPDPQMLHAGLPVGHGTKSIATRWIRRSAFTYPPPVPLLDI